MIKRLYVLTLIALIASLSLVETADAKKKLKKISMGCTAADIQSAAASDCIDQMEKDVASGKPYVHALTCSISGKYCCIYDNGSNTPRNCKPVTAKERLRESMPERPTEREQSR